MYLNAESQFPKGTTCDISLFLETGAELITIRAGGIVVRDEPTGMALQFTKIFGPESFHHLQQLVLSNSGGHIGTVEKELSQCMGIRQNTRS